MCQTVAGIFQEEEGGEGEDEEGGRREKERKYLNRKVSERATQNRGKERYKKREKLYTIGGRRL